MSEKLTTEKSLELYETLFFVRRCEEYIIKHYPEDQMRTPMHMSFGQEAIPVGVCRALEDNSDTFASYRSHATFLAQTLDSDSFFGELYGRMSGPAEGKGGSMHLSLPAKGHLLSSGVVASPIPVGVGTAFANRQLATGRATAIFFGDGAVEEGGFWESLNAAAVFDLPVLFVCEDNNWAVHTPKDERHGFTSLRDAAALFDCHFYEDDSNDVEHVFTLTRRAVADAARRPRPVLMHLRCCRYLEHVGIDEDWDHGYRQTSERSEWQAKDCLKIQRDRLLKKGLTAEELEDTEAAINDGIAQSVARARQSPPPSPDRLHHGVFHEGR